MSITPAALAHVRRQLRQEGAEALVLAVTESGCNGYMYELDYATNALHNARSFRFGEDVRVEVAEDHWPLVRGTEIDFVVEGLNSALKFNNPNADAMCGCGESFSIRD
ncbi:MAG: iron-sulfur cluster assembly accessory protein [Gammaproteobacteria bacterium]|nr:iron-sulfur cluster assembly accessory protein [Gammaproteobacteria bacterium]